MYPLYKQLNLRNVFIDFTFTMFKMSDYKCLKSFKNFKLLKKEEQSNVTFSSRMIFNNFFPNQKP